MTGKIEIDIDDWLLIYNFWHNITNDLAGFMRYEYGSSLYYVPSHETLEAISESYMKALEDELKTVKAENSRLLREVMSLRQSIDDFNRKVAMETGKKRKFLFWR